MSPNTKRTIISIMGSVLFLVLAFGSLEDRKQSTSSIPQTSNPKQSDQTPAKEPDKSSNSVQPLPQFQRWAELTKGATIFSIPSWAETIPDGVGDSFLELYSRSSQTPAASSDQFEAKRILDKVEEDRRSNIGKRYLIRYCTTDRGKIKYDFNQKEFEIPIISNIQNGDMFNFVSCNIAGLESDTLVMTYQWEKCSKKYFFTVHFETDGDAEAWQRDPKQVSVELLTRFSGYTFKNDKPEDLKMELLGICIYEDFYWNGNILFESDDGWEAISRVRVRLTNCEKATDYNLMR
jgi:hypothetical protein